MQILRGKQYAADCLFSAIDAELLDSSLHPSGDGLDSISIGFEYDDGCQFICGIAGFGKVELDGDCVREVGWIVVGVQSLRLLFELIFLGDAINRSYIIEMMRIGVEILRFVSEVLHHHDAPHHKNYEFLPNYLQLVMDWRGADAKGGVEVQFEVLGGLEFRKMSFNFCVFVLYDLEQLLVLLYFHLNRNYAIIINI